MSSITETYVLASKARAKLSKEAGRSDHDLRKLVHHANLLDDLMDRIQNHKYEAKSVISFSPIRYTAYESNPLGTTTVTYDVEDSDDDSDSESDDDSEDEDYHYATEISYSDEDYDLETSSDEDDEEEQVAWEVNLQRVKSASFRSLPTIDELSEKELDDLESEEESSEDEEQEECDIVDLKEAPSLSYNSSTEDEDEEDEAIEHNYKHTDDLWSHSKNDPSLDQILLDTLSGDITSQARTTTATLICT